jgi:NADPH2:quinone reductase
MEEISMRDVRRAVIAHDFGPPESFSLEPFDPGRPAPREVRVAIKAAGISFADLLVASGTYQVRPPLPMIPGSEFAGYVEDVGSEVHHLAPGDYVAGSGMTGAFAETVNVPVGQLNRVAKNVPVEQAAVFSASISTAYLALVERAAMQPGETVVILGAAGAVGIAGIKMAKLIGGHVIASASSHEKRQAAKAAGADVVIDSSGEDWRTRLQEALGGRSLDIVYDPVGGSASEPALRSLGWKGRHLVIGFAAGAIPKIATNLVLLKGVSIIGVELRRFWDLEPEKARQNNELLFEHLAAGQLEPLIAARFPIDRFGEACNFFKETRKPGRVVLLMP